MPNALHSRSPCARIAVAMLACAALNPAPAARAGDDVVLTPQRVSEHVCIFQGEPGAVSRGFMSDAREFQPFEDACAGTDRSRCALLPAFAEANRIDACGTYLLLEQEELRGARN
jgi:hypothetical protein